MSAEITGHVLVVDDQDNWREALRVLLETEGFHVSEASNFEQAHRMLHSLVYDVVLLDVRLIDDDTFNVEGLALLNTVKSDCPSTRVVLVTGYPQSIADQPDADALIFKLPQGVTFDGTGFKRLVRSLAGKAPVA
jgi:DNA-binding NtrC family response regulator